MVSRGWLGNVDLKGREGGKRYLRSAELVAVSGLRGELRLALAFRHDVYAGRDFTAKIFAEVAKSVKAQLPGRRRQLAQKEP